MAQRLLIEPQSGDEDSDCEEDDLLLKDPTQSYYNVNFAPVLKVSYLLRLQVLVDAWGKDNFFWFLPLAMKIEVVFCSEVHLSDWWKYILGKNPIFVTFF